MRAALIGFGCGGWDGLSGEGAAALREADAILGAARLLVQLPPCCTKRRVSEARPAELFRLLREHAAPGRGGWERPCVIYSGDSGFYSGARLLLPLLDTAEIPYRVIPGISSLQVFAARLGRSWENWALYSAHGMPCNPVTAVSGGKAAFFLTGTDRETSPAALCGVLERAGLGNLPVTIGENLGGPGERITRATAAEAARKLFAPLSVLLAEPAQTPYPARTPGIPDTEFLRGNVPMTKEEVRAAVLSKLALRPADTVWDIGAGTGSVSIALARAAYRGRVFAVEREGEACDLIRRNRERFGAWNLELVSGEAPRALDALPPPDAVFIGGGGGKLEGILDAVWDAAGDTARDAADKRAPAFQTKPGVRVCISAVTLETLSAAVHALTARGLDVEAVQIAVSRTRTLKAGTGNNAERKVHLLTAQNPVFLITAAYGETS